MVRLEDLVESQIEDAAELADLGAEARAFLEAHSWCASVRQGWFDRGWAGVLAVFYFEIEPAAPEADDAVWVITGDVPPAYLDVQTCPNGATAIDAYVGAMEQWVDHASRGEPVDDLIPVLRRGSLVPVPPTREYAEALRRRLDFIDEMILSQFPDELRD